MEPPSPHYDFEELFRKEDALLSPADPRSKKEDLSQLETETPGPAGEPWISYTPVDRVGLAFSGGGIRSATFNLGVLKALHDLKVLKHVDYLSTVSGGGYIGAWWTAWRARVGKTIPKKDLREFPTAHRTEAGEKGDLDEKLNREPEEVRHLREFSNFLSPRIGFFQSEMWNAIMAVLSAVLPAVVVASSVIALALLIWLGFNTLILPGALETFVEWLAHKWDLSLPNWVATVAGTLRTCTGPFVLSVTTLVIYFCFERKWRNAGKAEELPTKESKFIGYVAIPILILGIIWFGWPPIEQAQWMNPTAPQGPTLWEWSTGISPVPNAIFSISPAFSPHLFDAPILWVGIAILLLVPRLLIMRFAREKVGPLISMIDRALSRMLGAALIFVVLAIVWLIGCRLNYSNWGTNVPAGGALVSGGAFALLRNWIGRLGPSKKGGIMDLIKPLIPQILAYVAIALWAICIAAFLAGWIGQSHFSSWKLFAIALGIVLFAIVSFDPAQVSMHSFYRNRLARAYLGASNIDADQSAVNNRQTDVRAKDDIQLRDLSPQGAERPIHLVCCTANDLGGDQLENLSRGSRSAVLSKFGFAIGDHCHTWEKEARAKHDSLGLGSAITASAAAFNSNMGSLSMTLGAGVTFLCTALNLRLGLWLPHPLTDIDGAPRRMPGLLFLKEMFGLTNCGLRPSTATDQDKPVAEYVHLSDGGHFENLALYELVRRHCRYIIVSDCGADPEVTLDDFGNAVRRIREDFGVEIDIDLSPLRPNANRLSKQHVAVGTISYDPRGDRKDNAILLYFKPALTGDEPCDITQYRTRNEDFPHESTGDQFYDEAQWESYRRLGEHAAHSALRFVERMTKDDASLADAIFNGARWEWYQSAEQREEKVLQLTGRLTALEQQLRNEASPSFIREMYPELSFLGADAKESDPKKKPTESAPEEIGTTLHFLTQMIQLMEDVWFACDLETYWNDPNNLGWINTFQRWAYTPSFRLWWPILKPMYGGKFRRFMEEHLSLADEDYPPTTSGVNEHGTEAPRGVAQIYWKRMHEAQDSEEPTDKKVYSFDLELTLQNEEGNDPFYVQAGLAFLDLSGKPIARWNVEDFFVPPSLWGAGWGAIFLTKLLANLKDAGFGRCEVMVEAQKKPEDKVAVEWTKRTDMASRQQLNDLLAFYQRAHFSLEKDRLVLDLNQSWNG